MVEASVPSVVKCLEAMRNDPVLAHFPFDAVSFGEIVLRVIKSGTPLERAALAKHMTLESAYFFPSAWRSITGPNALPIQSVIDQIMKPLFGLLCDHYGVPFSGNMDTVAYSILNEFGGLSFADYLICFERVKVGRYRRDTQHIMTRGINAEFIAEWLTQYAEEREEARAAIYSQHSPDNIEWKADADTAENIREYKERQRATRQSREEIQRVADAIFTEWDNGLYTTGMFRQWFKTVWVEVNDLGEHGEIQYRPDATVKTKSVKQETICEAGDPDAARFEDFPIRVPKAGAIERKVKRIMYEFVVFGDRDAMDALFLEWVDRVRAKYIDEEHPEKWVEAEMKTLISAFGTVRRRVTGRDMVEAMYRKLHPDASQQQIAQSARGDLERLENQYFDVYLLGCITAKYPRLDIDEFLIASILPTYIEQGFGNPFKMLFE